MDGHTESRQNTPVGLAGRVILALAGFGFIALPLMDESGDPGVTRLYLLGGLFLWGALAGTSTPSTWLGARKGSFWAVGGDDVPRAQPITTMLAFGTLLGIYGLIYGSWTYPALGCAVGLFLGACAPWFAYRLAAFFLVTIAVAGFMIGIGAAGDFGVPGVLFLAGCFGFVYAALFWADKRFGFFWGP